MSQSSNESQTLSSLKSTPYRSTGIPKKLLTPCRRVGLSRKLKSKDGQPSPNTPLASTVPSVINNTISPVVTIRESPLVTPIVKQSEESVPKRKISGSSRANIESRFQNKPVEATPSTDDFTVDNTKAKAPKIVKKQKVVPKDNKKSSKVVLCDNSSQENISKQSCENPKLSLKEIEPELTKNDSKKKLKRSLSLKKSSSSVDELTDVDLLSTPKTSSSSLLSKEFLTECSVNVDRMPDIDEETDAPITAPVRKKRCMVLSSDDEEDFIPSPHSVKKETEDWLKKIDEVKKAIKKKEAHLGDLKQAAVYRRLHDVTELQESIKMWRKCCEEGLTNLLPMLKEYGEMEMDVLLKKFNVPKTIIYDANTDAFIK